MYIIPVKVSIRKKCKIVINYNNLYGIKKLFFGLKFYIVYNNFNYISYCFFDVNHIIYVCFHTIPGI
jgi:hypothetical protein